MYVFIGGVPTAGKTHLAKDYISNSKLNIKHIETDKLRDDLVGDKDLEKWINFFRNMDENEYWKKTSCTQHMKNGILQSEALWPYILERINNLINKHEHIIFEGTLLLPNLTRKYLDINGFYLVPMDIETIYIRLVAHTRWGKTNNLKRSEAKCFFEGNAKYINTEAREYGYKVFNNIEEGYSELNMYFNKTNA